MRILFDISLFFLLYIYFGYFILIGILAKLFSKHIESKSGDLPFISIIIPVRNEEISIQAKIENTLNLDYPEALREILIIDSDSQDGTAQIVEKYASQGVTLYKVEHLWKAYALKKAIDEFCKGEIILITDVSAKLEKDVLKVGLPYLYDAQIFWITAPLSQIEDIKKWITYSWKKYWQMERILKKNESLFESCVGFTWKFSLFRKRVYKGKNWYFTGDADDLDMALFALSNGGRVIQVEELNVCEVAPDNHQDIIKQRQRIITQTISSVNHYLSFRLPWRFLFIFISRKVLPLLSPAFVFLNVFSSLFLISDSRLFSLPLIFFIFSLLIWVFKVQMWYLKYLYYVILLNGVICISYLEFFSWKDYTKWEKIMSTRK